MANVTTTVNRKRVGGPKQADEREQDAVNRHAETVSGMQRALAERLIGTRAEFQEATRCYSVRIQGILAHIGDVLSEDLAALSDEEARRRERALLRALERLDNLELKPSKGRRRDLKAVENLATDLVAEIADW